MNNQRDPQSRPSTNRLAVVALVVAVLGVVLFWPVALVGAAVGVVAANQIKSSDEGGAGLALAAIVVGLLAVPITLLIGAIGP